MWTARLTDTHRFCLEILMWIYNWKNKEILGVPAHEAVTNLLYGGSMGVVPEWEVQILCCHWWTRGLGQGVTWVSLPSIGDNTTPQAASLAQVRCSVSCTCLPIFLKVHRYMMKLLTCSEKHSTCFERCGFAHFTSGKKKVCRGAVIPALLIPDY